MEDSRNPIPVPGMPVSQPRIYLPEQGRELHEDGGRGNERAEPKAEKMLQSKKGRDMKWTRKCWNF